MHRPTVQIRALSALTTVRTHHDLDGTAPTLTIGLKAPRRDGLPTLCTQRNYLFVVIQVETGCADRVA